MELKTFQERIYGRNGSQLFVFEPSWDSFRPISGIAWNGTQFIVVDSNYKKNIFDTHYGYGSQEMKDLCKGLTTNTELSESKEIRDPSVFWQWYRDPNIVWWRDRACVFASPCTPRDISSWKQYVHVQNSKARTLRHMLHKKRTKRLLLSSRDK
uniref:Uncharacterized protein n=1 Tax=viral metagenome TaxID=1070528 RepID=A0A6C0JXZ1_9ZZZZ